ncbi:MAG: hypothetical protein AMK71_01145 [Nitrospira bacterium SG8_35_4]|nr:MAG: hypothetical protein AMK71_01145 [Nitrospira bacterium SG8_35_4]
MAAFSARRLVWSAMDFITETISPTRLELSPRFPIASDASVTLSASSVIINFVSSTISPPLRAVS